MSAASPCYRFGRFELQPAERRLLAAGKPAVLTPRAFDVLVALVERSGHLVSKDELLERVWPHVVVEENNLQVHISALRKLLGAGAIATVAGHGYRFTLELDGASGGDAARVSTTAPHNLPNAVTSFVGRSRELAEVRESLKTSRLVTLTGFGGVGKTRLALEAVAQVSGFANGVWLVELAGVGDARLVPQAAASVLGIKEEAGRPVIEALLKHVKDRELLLILDSCEHLLAACADVTKQLLQSAARLKIVATSRERLNMLGETVVRVPPLSLPASDSSTALATLLQSEAVQLFVDRATAAHPAFAVDDRDGVAVVDICRRVDGIPLAIELAAARVSIMSVHKIAERLRHRFQLLTRGDRTALPHRQTLRALIDWSHELLDARERALLRRLAVFPGTFTLEAAEAVAAGGRIEPADVLDLLAALIERSMVVVDRRGDRYRLLDTVRDYSQERLEEAGEEHAARDRHLAFYREFAERARPELFRSAQAEWLVELDLERGNLLAAQAWCDRSDAGALEGLRLAYALKPYWFRNGLLGLGLRFTRQALDRPGADHVSLERCRATLDAGHLCMFVGEYSDARRYLADALEMARNIDNRDRTVAALRLLGETAMQTDDHAAARTHLEEALALARELGDPFRLSDALDAMGAFHRWRGELENANACYEENLSLARERGDLDSVAITLANLAMVSTERGQTDRAPGMALEALVIAARNGSRWAAQEALAVAAGLAIFFGECERGARLYGAVKAGYERMGVRQDPAEDTFMAPTIAKARREMGEPEFAAAVAAGRSTSHEDARADARSWLERLVICSRAPTRG